MNWTPDEYSGVTEKIMKTINKEKIKIVVIAGGPSSEYEVSLKTSAMVVKNLNPLKYEVTEIVVSKKGKWPVKIESLKKTADLAFIAMHGEFGEDGQIQKLLEKSKILYTGSDAKTSALTIDKIKTANKLKAAGVLVPTHLVFKSGATVDLKKIAKLGSKWVVKPVNGGSSIGTTIVSDIKEISKALKLAFKFEKQAMIQPFVAGRELTCGLVEKGKKVIPLPPTEIIPLVSDFFNYEAKYQVGGSKEVTPPENLDPKIIKKIQTLALKVYKVLGARHYARVDFILDKENRLWVLEINTLPGMTETSLLPQAAKVAGFSFGELLDMIISNARSGVGNKGIRRKA